MALARKGHSALLVLWAGLVLISCGIFSRRTSLTVLARHVAVHSRSVSGGGMMWGHSPLVARRAHVAPLPFSSQRQNSCRRDHLIASADFNLFDDNFDPESPEAKMILKTMPEFWGTKDIRTDIEENMRIPVPEGLDGDPLIQMWVQCKLMTMPKYEFNPDAEGWEKWRYERPKLMELARFYEENFRTERLNVLTEYCNNPENAKERYGNVKEYVELMARIQDIMDTPPRLSNKISFSGFPSMLDEETVRGTFEEFGTVVGLEYIPASEDDEETGVSGVVEFESPDIGQKAIAQWNGVDMGMGVKLKLKAIEAED